MDATLWSRARSLFEASLDLPEAARRGYVAEQAGADAALAAAVERLLAAHLDASAGLRPSGGLPDATSFGRALVGAASAPARVGPYAIVRAIGAGGMGTVYEAEEERPRRRVALKVLHGAWADARARARFADEIEMLARLEHPGIARMLAAGEHVESSGAALPWFAMELVAAARTLPEAAAGLSLDARVELFARVCDAVQHGHLNGVIHRDLKAGNVLVGADGQPKVIDFGVARAVAKTPDGGRLTISGEILGTPACMSPEQFDGRADVRSDVWALGALLYELLAGKAPHDVSGCTLSEAARRVQSRPAPPLRAALPDAPLELQWILGRALEIEPERRYASAGELGADLRRWRSGELVHAAAPSGLYRARVFVRRHRVGVAASLAIALLLVAGVRGTTAGMYEAREQARIANASLALMVDLFRAPDPALGGLDVRVIDALSRADESMARALVDQPRTEAALRHALGRLHRNLGAHERAALDLSRARELLQNDDEASPEALDEVDGDLGLALIDTGRLDEAEELLARSLAWRRERLGPDAAATGRALSGLGLLRLAQRRLDEAQQTLADAAAVLEAALGPTDEQALAARLSLAGVLRDRTRIDEADAQLTPAVQALRDTLGDSHPLTVTGISNLAALRTQQRRFDEAARLMEIALEVRGRILPDEHAELQGTRSNLATLHILLGELDAAEPILAGLLAQRRAARRMNEASTLTMQINLATIHVARGDGAALAAWATDLLADAPGALAAEIRSAEVLENGSRFLFKAKQGEIARQLVAEALAIRGRLQGEGHPDTLLAEAQSVLHGRGVLSDETVRGQLGALHVRALEQLPAGHYAIGAIGHESARALMADGQWQAAEPAALAAAAILQAEGSDYEARTAAATCADLYEALGRAEDAAAWRAKAEAGAAGTP